MTMLQILLARIAPHDPGAQAPRHDLEAQAPQDRKAQAPRHEALLAAYHHCIRPRAMIAFSTGAGPVAIHVPEVQAPCDLEARAPLRGARLVVDHLCIRPLAMIVLSQTGPMATRVPGAQGRHSRRQCLQQAAPLVYLLCSRFGVAMEV